MSTPIEQLSNAQIKEELRALYAVTDFGDCIEVGDLQKKLQTVRDTAPITHGLRYGTLLEMGNKKNPTGVVTLAHGLGDSAHGWEDVGYELARRMPYLLFLLPTAPSRPVTINGGMKMPAWYDITDMIGEGLRSSRRGAAEIHLSGDYVRSVVHVATKKYGILPRRVVYGGFSQGAAVALSTGLTAHVAPAGIACMSGYLAAAADMVPRIVNKAVPITMFHGRQDPVVPLAVAHESKEILEKDAGVAQVDFKEYDMQHSAVPQEIDDLAAFISRVLPEKF
ncbi:putative mitochondrial lysophospholipase [Leptomonas pyrrhocoris]|uniref:Putative mitochondrial lysophospholipase n=1 Tax=Leptomonas pyrrhocoris TaxID=157538 RepID=A0A0N0VF10_LEPPY|nr:putative mitochondrial lysophospholipase [Leptomonas pyrrhocoris]XP_015657722.1 putative mitochondrial lysophospholipase [Leptomonas pyrrhocoris]KPA79282.1 putative mitochondrial lysophospholipase [Leptomonas pyrrhocoris]KPA79283.1 putative mitochondrial lysophospholipase [Leptomonas pyrrhocoris]|eukprot:XP_015657721.1 putative mitochondrial lysophospholipase [Leptomonas pyrrhocoris]